jgi:ketosteroid isomerase-like protein
VTAPPESSAVPDVEANRRLALEFFARFDAGDVAGAVALLADDVVWWIAGKPHAIPSAGEHDKTWMERLFRRMLRKLEGGLGMRVLGTVAEGDRVAVELRGHGRFRDGRVYENEYHTLLTIRGGRIVAVREYLDTEHVLATWFPPAGG